MDKIFNLFPKGLLSAYLIKMIMLSPTINDVGIFAALAGVVAIQIHLEKKNTIEEVKAHCNKQIEEIKTVVNKQIEVISTTAVEISKLKNEMMGVKLKSDFSNGNPLTGKKAG